jgi:hypothetical protein
VSDTPAEPKGRATAESEPSPGIVAAEIPPPPDPPATTDLPPPAGPEPARRRTGGPLPWLIAAGAVVVVALAALASTPFWAPAVMPLLPWGPPNAAAKPAALPSPPAAAAPAASDSQLAGLRSQAAQNAASLQQLGQRLAALEAKPAPPPDLTAIQQQLAALDKTTADLGASVATLEKLAKDQPRADPNNTALALVLLQIRDAVDIGRPFAAEYQALLSLAHDHPEVTAAAQPLAEPATSGVASRAALAERLHQLAPQIATAKPPPGSSWRSQIVARLRSLVTIRRIDGAAQSPAEAKVNAAERAMASGDLAGAVDALSGLTGPPQAAAEPWLRMARQRLAIESALRQVAAAVTAALGTPAPGKG